MLFDTREAHHACEVVFREHAAFRIAVLCAWVCELSSCQIWIDCGSCNLAKEGPLIMLVTGKYWMCLEKKMWRVLVHFLTSRRAQLDCLKLMWQSEVSRVPNAHACAPDALMLHRVRMAVVENVSLLCGVHPVTALTRTH